MVRLLTTGGTIAMSGRAAAPTADAGGLAQLPELAGRVEVEAFANKPSCHLGWADALGLCRRVGELTAGDEAVVVTHGTDLLEEVALLCDLVYAGEPPVVFTGAMRPASAPGADGPANLLDAVAVAEAPHARSLGVVVAFAGEVHAARTARKVASTGPAAFASPLSGPLGHVREGRLTLRSRPLRPAPLALPGDVGRVEVAHVGIASDELALLALAELADGLVVVVPGAGHVPPATLPALREAAARIPVLACARPERGAILRGTYGYAGAERDLRASGVLCAGALNAAQARVLLAVCLGNGLSREQLAEVVAFYDV